MTRKIKENNGVRRFLSYWESRLGDAPTGGRFRGFENHPGPRKKMLYDEKMREKAFFVLLSLGGYCVVLRKVRVRKWSNWPQSRVWKMLRTPWSNNQQFCAKIIPQSLRRYPRPRDTVQRVFFVGGSLLETIAPYGNQPEVKKKREMEVKWRVSRCLFAPLQAAPG